MATHLFLIKATKDLRQILKLYHGSHFFISLRLVCYFHCVLCSIFVRHQLQYYVFSSYYQIYVFWWYLIFNIPSRHDSFLFQFAIKVEACCYYLRLGTYSPQLPTYLPTPLKYVVWTGTLPSTI